MSWILFLSVTGLLFICLEVFLPGMVLGFLGALCLIGAVILTYFIHGSSSGHMALSGLLISSAIALVLWIRFFPQTRSGKSMITQSTLADSKTAPTLDGLRDQKGKAITPLRPAGVALIGNERVDVMAEAGLIAQDATVQVVRVEGNRVFVRKI